MQWKKNKWIIIIAFFAGVLVCYISTRFKYFEIKKELDVPALLLGILGLAIGLYIADTIQKRITKNQNKYTFLESKIDNCWTNFSSLAKIISLSDKLDLETLSSFNQDITHQLGYIKNIFEAFDLNCSCIENLESNLDEFEHLFDDLPTEDNIKYYSNSKDGIENKIIIVNQCFAEVLKTIQDIE